MNFEISLIEDILPNTWISQHEICSNNIFVESNPAEVEIVQISKVNSEISKTKENKVFNLITTEDEFLESDISDSANFLSKKIDNILLHKISLTEDIQILQSKKKKVFGFLTTYILQDLIESLHYYNWIIINDKLKKELIKISGFTEISETKSRLNHLTIFYSNELQKDIVLAGMSESITSIFNRDIKISKSSNQIKTEIDYLFEIKKITKFILS